MKTLRRLLGVRPKYPLDKPEFGPLLTIEPKPDKAYCDHLDAIMVVTDARASDPEIARLAMPPIAFQWELIRRMSEEIPEIETAQDPIKKFVAGSVHMGMAFAFFEIEHDWATEGKADKSVFDALIRTWQGSVLQRLKEGDRDEVGGDDFEGFMDKLELFGLWSGYYFGRAGELS